MKAAINVLRVTRGVTPANIPLTPLLRQMSITVFTEPAWGDVCTPVLMTSAGCVMIDAISPATTPQEKRSGAVNTSV